MVAAPPAGAAARVMRAAANPRGREGCTPGPGRCPSPEGGGIMPPAAGGGPPLPVRSARHRGPPAVSAAAPSLPAVSRPARLPGLGLRLWGGVGAAAAAAGLAAWLSLYALDRGVAAALLAAWALAVALRPALWLPGLALLWPVADLVPWSGQIHVTETDALALATLLGLGLREAVRPPAATLRGRAPARAGLAALVVFGLLAVSVLASAWRGLGPAPAFDAAAWVGYATPLNALRVAKGFGLALALLPFLHAAVRREGEPALQRITLALALGLGSCSLAAAWERHTFTGLLDLASDYRSTALFWEMHVGGAALDGWLLLTFPFALAWLLQPGRRAWTRVPALVVVTLGTYAIFTTFSRIVIPALLLGLALWGVVALWAGAGAPAASPHRAMPRPGAMLVLGAGLLSGCALAFDAGGYRTLMALAGLAVLVLAAGDAVRGLRAAGWLQACALAAGLGTLGHLGAPVLPKGPYLVYALSWLVAALLLWGLRCARAPRVAPLAVAVLLWTALNVVLVGLHWREEPVHGPLLLAVAPLLAALLAQAAARTPLWRTGPREFAALGAVLVVGGMTVAGVAGYQMQSRLASSGEDLRTRLQHWRDGLALVGDDLPQRLLGIGLGRFPEAYFWQHLDRSVPGSLALVHEDGTPGWVLRVGSPRRAGGGAEPLRVGQKVSDAVRGPLRWRLRMRSPADTGLSIGLCRKHLLYSQECIGAGMTVAGGQGWQVIGGGTRDGALPAVDSLLPHGTVLAFSVEASAPVEIAELQVWDEQGRALLHNADFAQGFQRWFFSSDHDHLPWHAKNLLVHLWVEQGALGLLALGGGLVLALGRLLFVPSVRRHPLAPVLAASLAGFAVVGLVDSLVDMPRVMVAAYAVLWLALTLRAAPAPARGAAATPSRRGAPAAG